MVDLYSFSSFWLLNCLLALYTVTFLCDLFLDDNSLMYLKGNVILASESIEKSMENVNY